MRMTELPELYRHIAGRFDDASGNPAEFEFMTMEDVRLFVRNHVARLLDHNPAMLMSILYRIDVSEAQVQNVLKLAGHDEISDRLAELIIDRQLQKLRLRRRYSEDSDSRPEGAPDT
jgi:hypothetical protein